VAVDGKDLGIAATGMVVVANCRQYMWGLNPAPRARMDDGRLDVVVFPIASRRDLVGWLVRCSRGRHVDDRRLIRGTGTSIEIRCPEAHRFQLDGDPPPRGLDVTAADVRIGIEAGVLPVLVPPVQDR
jgi:diacylglycerol kinase family enzyme